jgi:hypothetical protein
MKTGNLLIICGTALIAVWIWSASDKRAVSNQIATETRTQKINLAAIQNVLQQDTALGTELRKLIDQVTPNTDEDLNRVAALINSYVDTAKTIPITECPTDFGEAYYRHLGAWTETANVTYAHPHVEGGMENFLKNFARGAILDLGGPERDQKEWNDWKAKINAAQSSISKTWNEVESLAVRYGAK